MEDRIEVDFFNVGPEKSGDAIAMRYRISDQEYIHIVDGGFKDTGKVFGNHIKECYDNAIHIDYVVVTHPHDDHANGLQVILNEFDVGELWMLRPWEYADELLPRFPRFKKDGLVTRLKECFPNIVELEKIANDRGIRIRDPFQGAKIGYFTVMAPSKTRYLDLIVDSEKTPDGKSREESLAQGFVTFAKKAIAYVAALWGDEKFSEEPTSAKNEMSIVQYASIAGKKFLLTGDVGRDGLRETIDYAPSAGLSLPGVDRFQVPHHGSRRNVSSDILNELIGPKMDQSAVPTFSAIISAAKNDENHPRKSVVRAMMHRGCKVIVTKGNSVRTGVNQPAREGWGPATPLEYPTTQEDD